MYGVVFAQRDEQVLHGGNRAAAIACNDTAHIGEDVSVYICAFSDRARPR